MTSDNCFSLAAWKENLVKNKEIVLERYGQELYDHYIKYFDGATDCFKDGYWDVYQASLKRAKSVRVLSD